LCKKQQVATVKHKITHRRLREDRGSRGRVQGEYGDPQEKRGQVIFKGRESDVGNASVAGESHAYRGGRMGQTKEW